MDVLVLIDKLDDTIHNAKPVPLTDQVRVDKEEIYDILDQMRATIPEEIKQARWIVKERQEMLAEAIDWTELAISMSSATHASAHEVQNRLQSMAWRAAVARASLTFPFTSGCRAIIFERDMWASL